MDISPLKWPAIVLVACGALWLVTSGGVNYMERKLVAYTPGQGAAEDDLNEKALTKLGGFLLMTFRYERAENVFAEAVDRYGTAGQNYWYNIYRMVKCAEKRGDYATAVDQLIYLMDQQADFHDERVPNVATLKLRVNKLIEVHELGELIP